MLPTDPAFSTAQNCGTMCCQMATIPQETLRMQAIKAHERILNQMHSGDPTDRNDDDDF